MREIETRLREGSRRAQRVVECSKQEKKKGEKEKDVWTGYNKKRGMKRNEKKKEKG